MIAQNLIMKIPGTGIRASAPEHPGVSMQISDMHYHDEAELIMVVSGSLICTAGGEEYNVSKGQILFIASGTPHATRTEGGVSYRLLQIKESDFLNPEHRKIIKYTIKLQVLSDEHIRVFESDEVAEALECIIAESKDLSRGYELMLRSHVLRIVGMLFRLGIMNYDDKIYDSPEGKKILPALAYINERFKDAITLSDVSSTLGFNESYFCRTFKLATGATFTEYLNFVRICKAEKLLSEGKLSIIEISSEVGFASVSYFTRVFKKYKNCSPGYYRTINFC